MVLHSFLGMNNIFRCMVDCNLLIHSPIDGYLDNFHSLPFMNHAAINIWVQFLCGHVFMSLECMPWSGIAGSYDNLMFNIWGTVNSSSEQLHRDLEAKAEKTAPRPAQAPKDRRCSSTLFLHHQLDLLHSAVKKDWILPKSTHIHDIKSGPRIRVSEQRSSNIPWHSSTDSSLDVPQSGLRVTGKRFWQLRAQGNVLEGCPELMDS